MITLTYGLGVGLAALAGVLSAPITCQDLQNLGLISG
jgi:branched-subunit amino acid ABC-type transport system permease component